VLKFLADVNIEKQIVDYLRQNDFDVLWVPDYNCKMNDEDLIDLANQEKRILITNDKDFGELIFLQDKLSVGIILFRVKGQNVKKKINGITKLLEDYKNKIEGNFVLITGDKIRFKTLRYFQ